MDKSVSYMSSVFDILSNEVRLCILVSLSNNKSKKVGELQMCAHSSQSMVSQQLSKLKSLGIIVSKKVGNEVYYSASNNYVFDIIRILGIRGVGNE